MTATVTTHTPQTVGVQGVNTPAREQVLQVTTRDTVATQVASNAVNRSPLLGSSQSSSPQTPQFQNARTISKHNQRKNPSLVCAVSSPVLTSSTIVGDGENSSPTATPKTPNTNTSSSSGSSTPTKPLARSVRSPARTPGFKHHSRVSRWHDSASLNQQLDTTTFSEYYHVSKRSGQLAPNFCPGQSTTDYQNEMIMIHGFSTFADQFHHIGDAGPDQKATKPGVITYTVPAQIENLDTGKIMLGKIDWCVDGKNCYHRMFEKTKDPAAEQALTQSIGLHRISTNLFQPVNDPYVNAARAVEQEGDVVTDLHLRKVSINDPRLHIRIHLYGKMAQSTSQAK